MMIWNFPDTDSAFNYHPEPRFEIGKNSLSLLVSILNGTLKNSEGIKKCLTPELVVRGTTDSHEYSCYMGKEAVLFGQPLGG